MMTGKIGSLSRRCRSHFRCLGECFSCWFLQVMIYLWWDEWPCGENLTLKSFIVVMFPEVNAAGSSKNELCTQDIQPNCDCLYRILCSTWNFTDCALLYVCFIYSMP